MFCLCGTPGISTLDQRISNAQTEITKKIEKKNLTNNGKLSNNYYRKVRFNYYIVTLNIRLICML